MPTSRRSKLFEAADAGLSEIRSTVSTSKKSRYRATLEALEQRLMFASVTFQNSILYGYWCPQFYTVALDSSLCCDELEDAAYADANTDAERRFTELQQAAALSGVAGPVDDTEPVPVSQSSAPVQYSNGHPISTVSDLTSNGFGKPYGQVRDWDSSVADGILGPGWNIDQFTRLVDVPSYDNPDVPSNTSKTIAVIQGGSQLWFDKSSITGKYMERVGGDAQLIDDGTTYFTLYDSNGAKTVFYDFNNGDLSGNLHTITDAGGNITTANWDTNSASATYNELLSVTRSNGQQYELWNYSYSTSVTEFGTSTPATRLTGVSLSRSNDGGVTYSTVQSVAYAYYGSSSAGGAAGFLKTATLLDPASNAISVWAYRYYTSGGGGLLKMVFNPQDYAKAAAAGLDPTVASSDSSVQPYASNYYKYAGNAVSWEQAAGTGSSDPTAANNGVFQYVYSPSNTSQTTPYSFNTWDTETTVYLPDYNQEVVYTNKYAQPMMDIKEQLGAPSNPVTSVTTSGSNFHFNTSGGPSIVAGDVVVIRGGGWDAAFDTYKVLVAGSGYFEIDDYGGGTSGLTPGAITIQKLANQSATYYRYYDNPADPTDPNIGKLILSADPTAVAIPLDFTAVYQTSLLKPTTAHLFTDLVNFNATTGLAAYLNTSSGQIYENSYYFPGTTAGWSFSGASGITTANTIMAGALGGYSSNQAGFIQGGSISQSINFTSTGTFTLNYEAALRETVSGATGNDESLQVYLDGSPVGTPPTLTSSSYSSVSASLVIAATGVHTVSIRGAYSVPNSGAIIDAVSINGTGAPSVADPGFEAPTLPAKSYTYDPLEGTGTETVGGGAGGYLADVFVKQGQMGAPQAEETLRYFSHTPSGSTYSIHPVASDTLYAGSDGTLPRVSSYLYTWAPSGYQKKNTFQTLPGVGADENGSGIAATIRTVYDAYGRISAVFDGQGYVKEYDYDNATGTITKTVTDASPYAANVLADVPVGYWRLGEASGTSAADSSGNNHNGTYSSTGVTLAQTGALANDSNTSASFNGSSGQFSVANTAALNTPSFTVEAWINASGSTNGQIAVGNNILPPPNYNVAEGWRIIQGTDGKWKFSVCVGLWGDYQLDTGVTVSSTTGQWEHIVGTFDNGTNTAKVYVNGTLTDTQILTHPYFQNTVGALTIGSGWGGLAAYFSGKVDDVSVYDHALSADQVTTHYSAGAGAIGQRSHLNLTTTVVPDGLGRPHEVISPNGNIDVYTYNDAAHEIRIYPGYQTGTTLTSGPIAITREYRPTPSSTSPSLVAAPLGQQYVYDEKMTELPTGSIHLGSDGLPDGGEAFGTIYSLSRSILGNGGRAAEIDDYTNLAGITYSTANAYLGNPFRIDGTTFLSSGASVYGGDGNFVAGGLPSWPSYLSAPTMPSTTTWSAGGTYWYNSSGFAIDMPFTDAPTLHQVAIYVIDKDNLGLAQRVDVMNADTGTLLDSRVISNFAQGEYLIYNNLSGHIKIKFTNLNATGGKAVLSGIFFGTGAATNYDATKFWFDAGGNLAQTQDPNGTITRQVFDAYHDPLSTWMGTNNIPTSGWWSPDNNNGDSNMVDVADMSYDIQDAPAQPTITAGSHNFGGSNDYVIQITYVVTDIDGTTYETAPSIKRVLFGTPFNYVVTPPSSTPNFQGATSVQYNVYQNGILQNTSPISVTSSWTEPNTGFNNSGINVATSSDEGKDGLLNRLVEHAINSYDGSDESQITEKYYDWRDRLVLSDRTGQDNYRLSGMQLPVSYNVYNNLNQVVETDQYSETGTSNFSIANLGQSNGVPSAPASGLLVAKGTTAYNDLGSPYLAKQFSVDPSTGAVGAALSNNYFYDNRGKLIADYAPGGSVTKYAYDGAGRLIKQSLTDGGVVNGAPMDWSHAGSLSSDVVLEQTLYSYDADSNVIMTIERQRFDNDPTSATGDLAGPSGGTLASRDYYSTTYFDASNRPTDSVNVGTNNGSSYTRPSSVPSGSSAVLVAHTDYDSAGRVKDQVDPGGNKTGYFYDMLGQQVEVVSNWDGTSNPTPGNSTNQIIKYAYDGSGHVFSMTAVQPSGGTTPNQTTLYEYAASAFLHDNDLLTAIDYPDKTTGLPSTSNQQTFTYDALQHVWRSSDQNGNVHWYLHDVVGREVADIALTLGTGVDGSIRRLEYSFTGLGLPYQQTSYTSAFGSTIANQVTDTYNGFGQLTSEYQYHDAFHNGTITYNYSNAVGPQGQYVNASNLTSVVYPNGRVIDYLYAGTSAVTSITHSGTTATATTSSPTGLGVGSSVTIQGASPSAYNGTFTITGIIDATHFTYTMGSTPVSNASGSDMTVVGTGQVSSNYGQFALSSITYASGLATATASSSLGLATGSQFSFTISGASPSAYNGTFVATVTGSTTFTYKPLTAPGSSATGTMTVGINIPTLDGAIGRVSGIVDHSDGNVLESYNYLGAGTIIQQNRPQPGVDLTYVQQTGDTVFSADGGDRYTGMDRFGRIIDQFWTNTNSPSSPTDRFQYGYDANGNVRFSNNLVSSSNSELYGYDAEDRLTSFQRGTLNSGHTAISGTPSVNESWSLDALGNWTGGTQNRGFNANNQVTSITGTSNTPTYDNNGNMTGDEATNGYTYDAWNRQVSANNSSSGTKLYVYDANGRMISTSFQCGGPISNSYYSADWQDVEDDKVVSFTLTTDTFVWGVANQDELISRDEKVGSASTTRIYAQQNPNNSVTALISSSGSVLQRFQYDVYGTASVLTSAWASTTDAYNWLIRFQAGHLDTLSNLYKFRDRDYDSVLGTWVERDPLGYVNGGNLYQAYISSPVTLSDPSGLAAYAKIGGSSIWASQQRIAQADAMAFLNQIIQAAIAAQPPRFEATSLSGALGGAAGGGTVAGILAGGATEAAIVDGLLVAGGGIATGGGLFLAIGIGALIGFAIGSSQDDPYSGFVAGGIGGGLPAPYVAAAIIDWCEANPGQALQRAQDALGCFVAGTKVLVVSPALSQESVSTLLLRRRELLFGAAAVFAVGGPMGSLFYIRLRRRKAVQLTANDDNDAGTGRHWPWSKPFGPMLPASPLLRRSPVQPS